MLFKRNSKAFLSETEMQDVMNAIRLNEKSTSGEVRIFIESNCEYVDPLEKAFHIFHQLKMFNTAHRNAVLIYIAYKDHDFALFGDKEIFQKAKAEFWHLERKRLAHHFYKHEYSQGIIGCVNAVGNILKVHFPSKGENKNELPDEIIFGK